MEQVSRRTFLKAIAAGSALLGGCSTGPTVPSGGNPLLQFWAFSDTRTAWQEKAWELYKTAQQPAFDVDFLIFPYNQMHDKIMITAQAGTGGPDIADIEISQFSRYIKGDVIFADMQPRLQEANALEQLYRPSATDPWSWDGKTYGLGNELNTCLMSYRWDIWEQAGVKTPIETWDEFTEQAKLFHENTGNYLIDIAYTDWGQWWMLTLQQKGGFFAQDGQPTIDSPESVNTLTFMQNAIKDGWSILRPTGQAYNAALSSGEVATLLGPSWNFSGFAQQNLADTAGKWHLQPLPRWTADGSRTATWGGTGVSVLRTAQDVEGAVDFVVWEHTTTEAVMFDFEERQVWPTWKPAFEDPRLTEPIEFFDNQKVGELFVEVSPEINTWYNSPFWPETTDACVRVGITPAMQNTTLSPEQAMQSAQQEATSIIAFQTA